MTTETFRKSERLCSKKAIANLFEKGKSFYSFPFQVIWLEYPPLSQSPAQLAISVSKKNFKRAVERNLIKRRIRETYRKQKHTLYEFLEKRNLKILFILILKTDSVPEYAAVEKSVNDSLDKLMNEIKKGSGIEKP